MALDVGQRVGDYEILNLLGAGGMGRVYRVRNIISDRVEAMKVLLPDYASEPELAARFTSEIRTLAGLEHPNIAQLRTAFQFENQLVMVMEFVEGVTLEALASQTRIPVDHMLEYATQVLSALSYAHTRGVTHRDIKPANIMITAHGLAKLMDFGIAKSTDDLHLTRPGTTMGSVYYMSPEQVRGGTVDARSDIYSFGVTLYEMLTGRKPFQADTSFSVLNAQLNEAPTPPAQVNPALPAALNDIVLHAMAKAPAERFQTAEDMRNAIKGLQHPAQAAAPAAAAPTELPAPDPAWKPVATPVAPVVARKSHRGLWIGVGVAVTLAALLALAVVLPRVFATHAGQQAQQAAAPQTQAAPQVSTPPAEPAPATPTPETQTTPAETKPAPSPTPVAPAQPAMESGQSRHRPMQREFAQGDRMHRERRAAEGSTRPDYAAQSQPSAAAQPPVPAGPSPKEVRDAHDRYANLGARADAAKSGVQSIRRQQQAQGFDLRGDIVAAMNRLDNDMNEANRALNQNDPASANQYMDRANRELATLETFLGQ